MKTINRRISAIILAIAAIVCLSCHREKNAELTTSAVTDITESTATGGGVITSDGGSDITERGVCWSEQHEPTVNDEHAVAEGVEVGAFTCHITGLGMGVEYYVRAYAINGVGVAYGNELSFTTGTIPTPAVTTGDVTHITHFSARCSGSATTESGRDIAERGFCWSLNANPSLADTHIEAGSGTGDFAATLTELEPNTTYYVRAYATNDGGTAYGEQKTFTTTDTPTGPTGSVNSVFTVSETQRVFFAQGNLQYQASTDTWRFAASQLEFVGDDNTNISATYDGWMDLFGWGTGDNPTIISESYTNYATFTDWGVNPISNGGNTPNQWRTLTQEEWEYLMFSRTTCSGIRFAKATVDGINGVVILPDDWRASYYTLNSANDPGVAYTVNTMTSTDWTSMFEAKGAVFLTAAGYRYKAALSGLGSHGGYWSSTPHNSLVANRLYVAGSGLGLGVSYFYCVYGQSVRLVADE